MKILVLGATGNTGRRFVEMALKANHSVRGIVRSNNSVDKIDSFEVIEGDVLDSELLRKSCHGVDAVVSCLGIRKENPADPMTKLLSPEDFTTQSATKTIDAMKQNGVKRIVVISSAGIGDSWETIYPEMKKAIETSNISKIFFDLNQMEKVLASSGLDSLAVRPVLLLDGEETGRAEIVTDFNKDSKIYTGDVARWMLEAVEKDSPIKNRTEMIGLPT